MTTQKVESLIPLEIIRKLSTETQRRNGARFSRDPDHGNRIVEDISNLIYDCPICFENIERDNAMWSCDGCYQVVHHDCIREWASKDSDFWEPGYFECPTCKHMQPFKPESTCWCGKYLFPRKNTSLASNQPINACHERCGRSCSKDDHNQSVCGRPCHAGPCSPCPQCCKVQSKGPAQPVPGNAGVIRNQNDDAPSCGSYSSFWLLIPLAISNIFLLTFLLIWTKWVTEPYNYPHWVFSGAWLKVEKANFALVSLLSVGNAVLTTWLFGKIYYGGPERDSVDRTTGRTTRKRFTKHKRCCVNWSILAVIFMSIWPVISFTNLPDDIWYRRMKNSCNGFDTRVSLDERPFTDTRWVRTSVATKIYLHNPGEWPVLPPLYIGSHVQHTNDSSEHYQNFYRISGSTPNTNHITIDFDFNNQVWRMLHLDQIDSVHACSVTDHHIPVVHPQGQSSTESTTLIKNGTWLKSTSMSNHALIIPELELQIPHWYEFTQSCAYEPFLKVHRTSNMTDAEIKKQADAKWNKDNEDTVVMRTASFGHSSWYTDVCIKNADWEQDGEIMRGIGDDMLVPLGLLVTYRVRMYSEGLRTFCYDVGPQNANQSVLT